jgi:hypothetical protein
MNIINRGPLVSPVTAFLLVACTTVAVHVAAAGQLQPYNVQTQFGASQVALINEAQGDYNVVFGVLDGSAKPEITDSTGQEYSEKVHNATMVAFVAPTVKGGYHVIKMTGVSKLVAIEYQGFTQLGTWGSGLISIPDRYDFNYFIPPNCFMGELFVVAQLVNTPDAWIAPSANADVYHTEVYDQMGVFVVKDMIPDYEPVPLIPEVLLTKQQSAQVTYVELALRR